MTTPPDEFMYGPNGTARPKNCLDYESWVELNPPPPCPRSKSVRPITVWVRGPLLRSAGIILRNKNSDQHNTQLHQN